MNPRTLLRALVPGLAGVILAGTLAATPAAAEPIAIGEGLTAEVALMAGCDNHPGVPDWFYPTLRHAAANPDDQVPDGWAEGDKGQAMMKIICNESSFQAGAVNPAGPYYGLGQLGMPAINASNVSFRCYWQVDECANKRVYYQALAALRYANQRYDGPLRAWAFWQNNHWW